MATPSFITHQIVPVQYKTLELEGASDRSLEDAVIVGSTTLDSRRPGATALLLRKTGGFT